LLPDLRVRQRDYLLEISRAITQELDLDKVLARNLTVSIEMLAGQAGLIALREQGRWSVAVSHGLSPAFTQQLEPLLATIPEHEEPELYELPEVNRVLQGLIRAASLGLLAGVALPLLTRGRVVGVLFVFRNYMGVFSTNDKKLLQSFADQAAIAVANAQLYTRLRHEERRMSALIDSVADGIFILTSDHLIEHCNPAFTRLLGVEASAVKNKPHNQIVRWAKLGAGQSLEEAERGGWPLTPHATLYVEGDLERPNRPPLAVGITYAPLLSPQGSLLNVIASARDISRFREAEELKSTFISVISHELKTPVALIKGYVSTLRREDVAWDREVVQDSLTVIEDEADRLTGLIENMLDASRLQAGALSVNLADVDLAAAARRIAERFGTQTARHTIRVDFPVNFPVVMADEDRLEQVFSNLISNAIKYSPKGGEIRISGQALPTQAVVCVSDQGAGIAQEDLPHVFDRFYRAGEASRTTKGAGLGLYLARAVVEAHSGRIWVDSKTGEGARICFSLPIANL
jgi:signal transduction histidine kinase